MENNAHPHRAGLVHEYLKSENIHRTGWPAVSSDLNLVEHVLDALGKVTTVHHPPPRPILG